MSADTPSVDVVALLGALDGNTSSLKLNSQVFRAKKAVAELIAAAVPFARRNSSEPTVPVTLKTEDVTRLRAALAKVEGVA